MKIKTVSDFNTEMNKIRNRISEERELVVDSEYLDKSYKTLESIYITLRPFSPEQEISEVYKEDSSEFVDHAVGACLFFLDHPEFSMATFIQTVTNESDMANLYPILQAYLAADLESAHRSAV